MPLLSVVTLTERIAIPGSNGLIKGIIEALNMAAQVLGEPSHHIENCSPR